MHSFIKNAHGLEHIQHRRCSEDLRVSKLKKKSCSDNRCMLIATQLLGRGITTKIILELKDYTAEERTELGLAGGTHRCAEGQFIILKSRLPKGQFATIEITKQS